jgi:hypothetical protein
MFATWLVDSFGGLAGSLGYWAGLLGYWAGLFGSCAGSGTVRSRKLGGS